MTTCPPGAGDINHLGSAWGIRFNRKDRRQRKAGEKRRLLSIQNTWRGRGQTLPTIEVWRQTLKVSDVILLDLRNPFCQLLQACMCVPANAAENLWSDKPNALLKNLASKWVQQSEDQRKKLKRLVARISKTLSWQSNATSYCMYYSSVITSSWSAHSQPL